LEQAVLVHLDYQVLPQELMVLTLLLVPQQQQAAAVVAGYPLMRLTVVAVVLV